MTSEIRIRGARTHNLKNINVDLPRHKLTVITGLSGSGKSSLAFDTLYAEGQRRYVESLSAYARQFLSMMEKPDMDSIEGLSPAISIEQKATSHNPRSTVGTVTEIYDYLRLLFARVGEPHCPVHGTHLHAQTVSQMVDQVLSMPMDCKVRILAPVVRERKGEHVQLLQQLQAQGYVRARIDGELCELDDPPPLALRKKHTIEVVVDRFKVRSQHAQRMSESFENALQLAHGLAIVATIDGESPDTLFSSLLACSLCGYSLSELEPRLFSFNNPLGACSACDGLGVDQFFDIKRVIHDECLSLADGAIRGWDKRTSYYFTLLESLAEHFDFSIDTPFIDMPKATRDLVLYGSGEEVITFRYQRPHGGFVLKKHPFEGIIPNMQRRYRESESNAVREELAKYISSRPCPSCEGARLQESARHVFIEGVNLPEISSYSIDQAYAFFKTLQLSGHRGEIAAKINQEIIGRLGFLINVGLDYLSLSRSAETLSGGEAQRVKLATELARRPTGHTLYVLDEPTTGLHFEDVDRLLTVLHRLVDQGNTVLTIEHNLDVIKTADWIVDLGPEGGKRGGVITAVGTPEQVAKSKTATGEVLRTVLPKTRTAKR